MVAVNAAAAVRLERLAAVLRTIQGYAQDVDILVVAGVDANLAEVHRSRVQAIEARPRFAAVRGLVQSAVLEAVRLLAILDVGRLAAEAVEERQTVARRAAARRQGQFHFLG